MGSACNPSKPEAKAGLYYLASLGYIAGSRPAWAMECETLLKREGVGRVQDQEKVA